MPEGVVTVPRLATFEIGFDYYQYSRLCDRSFVIIGILAVVGFVGNPADGIVPGNRGIILFLYKLYFCWSFANLPLALALRFCLSLHMIQRPSFAEPADV